MLTFLEFRLSHLTLYPPASINLTGQKINEETVWLLVRDINFSHKKTREGDIRVINERDIITSCFLSSSEQQGYNWSDLGG